MRRPFALMIAAAVTTGGLALTPAASSAPIEAGTLHGPGQVSPAAQIEPGVFDEGPSKSQKHKRIRQTEVCFTVHNIGDPAPHQVSGTLFHSQKRYTGGGTALLLQHGWATERSAADGARPQVTGVASMVDQLVGAGYVVFAVDRLGYARSPYPGSGWTLTVESYVEMTHEMVTQIRSGTYRVTNDTCEGGVPADRAAAKVVLVGLSAGAGITELYATRYHDIDGIVPLVYSSQGNSNGFGEAFFNIVVPQFLAGNDYVYVFPAGRDGYSQPCEDWLFYTDGVSDDALAQLCGPAYYGDVARTSPSGEVATGLYLQQAIQAGVGNVGPTPALLVFAEKDAIFTTAESGGGEPDTITPEMEMWSTRCNCDVEFLWQRDASHANWFHDSATEMTASVVEWLRSRGL